MTGGTGFIGKHLVRTLLRNENYQLVIMDDLSNSNIQGFYEFLSPNHMATPCVNRDRLTLYQIDIRNKDDVQRVFKKEGVVDVCIHLAARISVIDSLKDPDSTLETNVRGTQNVLSSASQVETPSFVFASSAAVYGVSRKLPAAEGDPTDPLSPYGRSKILGEKIVDKYCCKFRNARTLRIFNVYGLGQSAKHAGVITRFAQRILKDLPPKIYGDGNQIRDFISVDDVVRAIMIASELEEQGKTSEIPFFPHYEDQQSDSRKVRSKDDNVFNVGTGIPTTISDLARLMMEVIWGGNFYRLRPLFESRLRADIPESYADTRKSRLVLGFDFNDDLRSGLTRMFSSARISH